jgi:2-polyprenyl-6-methoxyphenol hydroxylase-like FAD-dependent oxidoreductase
MNKQALVSGASVAGLTTAFWLARTGWDVEVVERFDRFRSGGQNVDIRGIAHDVLDRMGLTQQVRENNTTEEGTSYIGGRGQVLGGIPADQEQDGPTAELEILRGDLAQLILDALPAQVVVRYGERIASVEHGVEQTHVAFQSGAAGDYDLVVIAEGVRSRTRDMIFGAAVDKRELGLNMAYGTIPRIADDDRWWRWYTAPGRRGITLRPDNVGTIRATLAYVDHANSISDLTVDAAKATLARVFDGAGWQAARVTAGFASSDDVYMDALTQIRMPSWSSGRVVVTGDAAWCVTPLGGGGTSLALIGGYVLAACLSQDPETAFSTALRQYERWMRPLVGKVQDLPKGIPDLFYPQSRAGVEVLRTVQRALSAKPLRKIGARFAHVAQTDQRLPDIAVRDSDQ